MKERGKFFGILGNQEMEEKFTSVLSVEFLNKLFETRNLNSQECLIV